MTTILKIAGSRYLVVLLIIISNIPLLLWTQNNRQQATGLIPATQQQLIGVPLASVPFSGDRLPSFVDLSDNLPPPGNQGSQNSCVGWSVAYALKSYQEKVEDRISFLDNSGRIRTDRVFSPAFIYNQINNGRDGGASFISALNLLSSQGAATWADMPYNQDNYRIRPSQAAKTNARRYRINYWRRVNVRDVKEVKAQLNAGYPVLTGIRTDDGFNEAKQGFVWQRRIGQERGAHAILLVGYNENRRAFKLINSYGRNWGDNGYGWINFNHFIKVAFEGYVAKDAINPSSNTTTRVEPNRRTSPVTPVPTPQPRRNTWNQTTLTITNVQHNTSYPNRPDLGYFMRLDGTVHIPPGTGRYNQVVVYFYYDAGNGTKSRQVASINRQYADINGFAACGTGQYPITARGVSTTWAAWIPYAAINVGVGRYWQNYGNSVYKPYTTKLLAEPILFIDNFGVKVGGLVPFTVTK
ncbi:MAG: C1 family peptidase [bacterium]|nr:C1 family peptidase [bacterium]